MTTNLKTLYDIEQAFLAYSPPDMKGQYTLERMHVLMDHLGNPQNTLKVIHIAGTSGKTSTVYFVRGLLEARGMKTGLTVSPHITAINERLQIGGVPLESSAYVTYTVEFMRIIQQLTIKPTYFELLIALAYWVFAKEKVDYAVIETGLGGLLDGTNVVSRADKVCVITDIGLDHTEILGNTLAEIATQKAGIIQQQNHVFTRQQGDEVMDVLASAAIAKQAHMTIVQQGDVPRALPVLQHHNWSLAVAVTDYIETRDNLPALNPIQQKEVAHQTPPGRWEVYRYQGKTIILDGAHNPQKIQALCDSLRAAHISSAAVLMNFISAPDAKIDQSLKTIRPFISRLIVPEFDTGQDIKSRQSVSVPKLVEFAQRAGIHTAEAVPDVNQALRQLLVMPDSTLIVTGSLYLVSIVRKSLRQLLEQERA